MEPWGEDMALHSNLAVIVLEGGHTSPGTSSLHLHILLFVTVMQLSIWLFKSFIAGNHSYSVIKTIVIEKI